jgi:tetratricopeptide (TPR) repeat protein
VTLLRSIIVILCALAVLITPAQAELTPTKAQELFDAANAAFRDATAARSASPDDAARLYGVAIRDYERLVAEIDNGLLRYNLANAYLLSGDVGRAVLEYRRAERLAPDKPEIRANLEEARRRVETRFEASDGLEGALLSWHTEISPRLRLGAFVLLSGVAWLMLGVRLFGFRALPRWPGFLLLALALLPAASLSVSAYHDATVREGVVIADSVVGRKGPDALGYAPSFSEPLRTGVEFTIVEQRPGWLYVELPDGRMTWITEGAIGTL